MTHDRLPTLALGCIMEDDERITCAAFFDGDVYTGTLRGLYRQSDVKWCEEDGRGWPLPRRVVSGAVLGLELSRDRR